MLNVYRDFYCLSSDSSFVPYIGFEIGYCHVRDRKFKLSNYSNHDGVALDGIIGLKTKLTEKVDLAFEIRQYVADIDLNELSIGMKLSRSF
jgi:outer membrane protein W